MVVGSVLETNQHFLSLGSLQEAGTSIMDASEDDQLAAAIAASMEGNNDVSDEDEMKQVEDIMDQEEKYGVETTQEPVVTLTPEPDGTAVSRVLLQPYFIADGLLLLVLIRSWSTWHYSRTNPRARRFPLNAALRQD